MEREGEARDAENLNGKDPKDMRINVEISNKIQKKLSTNGCSQSECSRRALDYHVMSQDRTEACDPRRTTEAAYTSYALTAPYEPYATEAARYGAYENRPHPPSSLCYTRDRSPMRQSPNRSTYVAAQTSAALASQYRSQAAAYGSQAALASAYGNQASAALASAYGNQASALASAYGSQASALASAYGNQAVAAALAAAYGNPTSAYGAQPSAYGTEGAVSYSTQASLYGTQGSTISAACGSQVSALTSPYNTQTSSNPYSSQSSVTSPYASPSTLNAYRQQQSSAYDASQLSALSQQAAYSALSSVAADTLVYDRTPISPQHNPNSEGNKKPPDSLKRLTSDRRSSELSEYRRLAESQAPYRRSPPKSQMDYQQMLQSHTDYSQYVSYNDYIRAAQLHASYQRRM
ncbi:uncharacterized protein WCC33_008849 isoform 1-T2 [Rhinophrynus dorsalis]